jgi:uncharacterized protein DUF6600
VIHDALSAAVLSTWKRRCLHLLCFCLVTAYVHSQTPISGKSFRPAVGQPSDKVSRTLIASLAHAPRIAKAHDEAPSGNSSADNPPARAARISYLRGNVSFLRAGLDQWSQAALNFTVTSGDRIYADGDSRAELEAGLYTVRISKSADLTVTNLNDQTMQLGLDQGDLRVSVYQVPPDNTAEVDTPNGALTLVRAGNYRVDVEPNGEWTLVTVNSGGVEITGGGISETVEAGQAVKLTGQDQIQVESVPMPAPDDFDRWSEERDRHIASSASAKYVSPATPGYDDLDEYGRWEVVADYGPVWYPPVAVGWVPYRFGHWAWIDPWGWTWVEDEPWGFCPFHFGRWVLIGAVWGWLPGPIVPLPVYAPALVAFIGGPGFSISVGVDLVGWFPLGPGEPFFPWYHYGSDYLRVVNITNIRNVTNITNITNINNIHYAYKTVATTAVPKTVLSSGQPVAHQVVHVPPEHLAKAQVVPHPPVNPTPRAAVPGKPVAPPPVRSHPVGTRARPASIAGRRTPSENPRTPPPTKAAPPSTKAAPSAEHGRTETAPRAGNREPAQPSPQRLITRRPPPPPVVPFADKHPAMLEHPGRPLEPRQVENLRAGRPPGPMKDHEFPPHEAPVVREKPAAPPPRPPGPRR